MLVFFDTSYVVAYIIEFYGVSVGREGMAAVVKWPEKEGDARASITGAATFSPTVVFVYFP